MLDIKFIRENKDLITLASKKKHISFDIESLIQVDNMRREKMAIVEAKRAEQNVASEKIAKVENPGDRLLLINEMKAVKESLQTAEEELKPIMKEWQTLMLQVPNVPDISVPEGDSDAENQEVRTSGEKPDFVKLGFKPRNHIELMTALDMADFERGTKVAGFRGYILKNEGMLLSFALWKFAIDKITAKGFTPMLVPSLVRRESFMGTGYLPQSEEDLYKTQDDDYLSGTGEVATMGYLAGETLDREKFPIKFASFSPCFRREAGSHGKDTQGLVRVHEFFKLEQVVLCEANHEMSVKLHEELTTNAEELLQALNLPYHVVVNCGGDLGLGQVKKYDIETWMPTENKYRETHSSSYFHDFQTRRLNIRYRDTDGKLKFAHSLNNTAIATPRILACIIENYQQADGSIKIPDVLVPYMNGKTSITK